MLNIGTHQHITLVLALKFIVFSVRKEIKLLSMVVEPIWIEDKFEADSLK